MSIVDELKADLKNFGKLAFFDIRAVVDNNEDLTISDYFKDVDKFILEAPQLIININHMRIIRNDAFFLNKLDSYNNILKDIDDYFLVQFANFKKILNNIGARGLIYLMEDLERQFCSMDLNLRNNLLLRLCVDINDVHNRVKRVYTPRLTKNVITDEEPEVELIQLSQVLKEIEYDERTRKLQIVVVDDMQVVLNSIVGLLNKHYKVFAFTRGDQVLKFLKNNSADLFLLDIEMPDMDGYELFHSIKEMDEHKDTPIIFMTGNVKNEYIETAIGIGISDLIVKPVEEHTLLKKIWNNVDRKKLF